MRQGLYEQLITKLISDQISRIDKKHFFINTHLIDSSEAALFLSRHISSILKLALEQVPNQNKLENQLELANKIIYLLKDELPNLDFDEDLIETEGKILSAVMKKLDSGISDFDSHLKKITPYTRLVHSELFTGNRAGISLESELRKEILSSNEVRFLVSFIKWKGIRIFKNELEEFTRKGGKLKVITTTYMGATEPKALEYLSGLPNTEVKVSYNTNSERLHAKAYLFYRETGFHTGYIGSSNISYSALTSGLEWNVKITTQEVTHLIEKFRHTFDSYWQDEEFELYSAINDKQRFSEAIKNYSTRSSNFILPDFTITPEPFQSKILDDLEAERTIHNRWKNLIVAATGTGKTIVAGFDFKRFRDQNPNAKLLFVAHRKEILEQALGRFKSILRDSNFGDLMVDGIEPASYDNLFASVQSLGNRLKELPLSVNFYDYIIIDEVHHITADSYRPILERFQPIILLGLTATPERMDGDNILADFDNTIASEIRLSDALNRNLLCPFQYFGISDNIDLEKVKWANGKYAVSELTDLYTRNDVRVGDILSKLREYLDDENEVRALGFCVSQEHAKYMAEKFCLNGLKADYLVSSGGSPRDEIKDRFRKKEINYLFVVDIFNEGVDIPEIDTVLFLRPTESLTVFLQQLGRGLRKNEGKSILTVLDFVGNARPEYDFEFKFRALVGKTDRAISKEIEDEFPHMPIGCSIVLEKKAKQVILTNIKNATRFSVNHLVSKIRNFRHQTNRELTLSNFIDFTRTPLEVIFKKLSWQQLKNRAFDVDEEQNQLFLNLQRMVFKKWLPSGSISYLRFVKRLVENQFQIQKMRLSEQERQMALMFYYDFWQDAEKGSSLVDAIQALGENQNLVQEFEELLPLLMNRIHLIEKEVNLPFVQPLKINGRYTRDQILAAFNLSTWEQKSSNREGVAPITNLNAELLMVDLEKSEEDYSPTTLYNDFAISKSLFHWQTQNATRPDRGKGLSYIHHEKEKKSILLFVREHKKSAAGASLGYVFLGTVSYMEHYGSKPMSITWQLHEPMNEAIWEFCAKLKVG